MSSAGTGKFPAALLTSTVGRPNSRPTASNAKATWSGWRTSQAIPIARDPSASMAATPASRCSALRERTAIARPGGRTRRPSPCRDPSRRRSRPRPVPRRFPPAGRRRPAPGAREGPWVVAPLSRSLSSLLGRAPAACVRSSVARTWPSVAGPAMIACGTAARGLDARAEIRRSDERARHPRVRRTRRRAQNNRPEKHNAANDAMDRAALRCLEELGSRKDVRGDRVAGQRQVVLLRARHLRARRAQRGHHRLRVHRARPSPEPGSSSRCRGRWSWR